MYPLNLSQATRGGPLFEARRDEHNMLVGLQPRPYELVTYMMVLMHGNSGQPHCRNSVFSTACCCYLEQTREPRETPYHSNFDLRMFSIEIHTKCKALSDKREEALTETGQNSVPVPETTLTVCTTRLRGQLHTILEDMDRYPNACLEELEAFMTLWDVKPRVEESSLETLSMDELITQLRQMCEDAEDRASSAQEEAQHKRKEALEEV
ncbi:hypothetical protein Tco_0807192, partial [Tanacetum coccineum]